MSFFHPIADLAKVFTVSAVKDVNGKYSLVTIQRYVRKIDVLQHNYRYSLSSVAPEPDVFVIQSDDQMDNNYAETPELAKRLFIDKIKSAIETCNHEKINIDAQFKKIAAQRDIVDTQIKQHLETIELVKNLK